MFDAHCHYPFKNTIFCTSELLPQNIHFPVKTQLIGTSEIGLDKRYEQRVPMSKQCEILKQILSYAKEKKICVSLHCVKATKLIIDILKDIKLKEKTALWHGFNGSTETAAELYKLGIIISIGFAFNKDIKKIYKANPLLVLETDYSGSDKEEHDILLDKIYGKFSIALGIGISDLEKDCKKITDLFLKI